MDKHRNDDARHEAKGAPRKNTNPATDNRAQQDEGNVEKPSGRAEQMIQAMGDRMHGKTKAKR